MLFVFRSFIRLDLVPTASVFCASSLFCLCVDPFSFLLCLCFVCLSLFHCLCVDLFSVSFSLCVDPFFSYLLRLCFVCPSLFLLLSVRGPILVVIPTVTVFCTSLFHCLCVDLFSVSFSLCMDLFFSVLLHLCFLCPSLFLSFLSACGIVFFLIPTASVFCLCISFLLPVFCASSL